MAQRSRNGVVFLQGHDGAVHQHGETWIAGGDVGGATVVFMVLRQDLQKMEAEPPDPTDHWHAPFAGNVRHEIGRLTERLHRRPVYQRLAARPHSGFEPKASS